MESIARAIPVLNQYIFVSSAEPTCLPDLLQTIDNKPILDDGVNEASFFTSKHDANMRLPEFNSDIRLV